jgi:hypothetical protein
MQYILIHHSVLHYLPDLAQKTASASKHGSACAVYRHLLEAAQTALTVRENLPVYEESSSEIPACSATVYLFMCVMSVCLADVIIMTNDCVQ